jgi:hypothetical protein
MNFVFPMEVVLDGPYYSKPRRDRFPYRSGHEVSQISITYEVRSRQKEHDTPLLPGRGDIGRFHSYRAISMQQDGSVGNSASADPCSGHISFFSPDPSPSTYAVDM